MRTHPSGLSVLPSASTDAAGGVGLTMPFAQDEARVRAGACACVCARASRGSVCNLACSKSCGFSPLPGMCATLIVQGFVKCADARRVKLQGRSHVLLLTTNKLK